MTGEGWPLELATRVCWPLEVTCISMRIDPRPLRAQKPAVKLRRAEHKLGTVYYFHGPWDTTESRRASLIWPIQLIQRAEVTQSMSSNHRIRLRGPWDLLAVGANDESTTGAAPRRVHFPTSWPLHDVESRTLSVRRSFGTPGGLGDNERCWLEIASDFQTEVALNGRRLASFVGGLIRVDITRLLLARNQVVLDFKKESPRGEPSLGDMILAEVALVIEEKSNGVD